jgi:hypothetical protein
MHILYIDDSGSVENANERFFILGAVSVFERGIFHQIKAADDCVATFGLGDPHDIELHGSPMYSGRDGVWRSVRDRPQREAMIKRALATLGPGHRSIRLFAIAVDKQAVSPRDPVALAFEEICNRFNLFLTRINDRQNDNQRGLIVMDESHHEQPLQMLARRFRIDGTRWGHFRNLVEVPLFVDSKASRLIQMADLVAWATWRKYEISDGRFFDPLIPMFDADGGVLHGLYHYRSAQEQCFCHACFSRTRRALSAPA